MTKDTSAAAQDVRNSDAGDRPDVEGHSLLQADLHRQIATSRSREAAEWARQEQLRREAQRRDHGRSGR